MIRRRVISLRNVSITTVAIDKINQNDRESQTYTTKYSAKSMKSYIINVIPPTILAFPSNEIIVRVKIALLFCNTFTFVLF